MIFYAAYEGPDKRCLDVSGCRWLHRLADFWRSTNYKKLNQSSFLIKFLIKLFTGPTNLAIVGVVVVVVVVVDDGVLLAGAGDPVAAAALRLVAADLLYALRKKK